jgi:FkbM family methyltransferase
VEPDARAYAKLLVNCPDCTCINAAVSSTVGALTMWSCEDSLLTTSSRDNKVKWSGRGCRFDAELLVPTISIFDLVRRVPLIDLVSIDTEGTSHEIFAAMRYFFKPLIWVIEVDTLEQRGEVEGWAPHNGYVVLLRNLENLVLGLRSAYCGG